MFNYQDTHLCPQCDEETVHAVSDAGHERDGSGDRRTCLTCGDTWSGLTGKYDSESKA